MNDNTLRVQVEVCPSDIAWGITDEQGFELIKEIDLFRADWDFTERVVLMLTKSLVNEGSGDELQSFKDKIKKLLKN